jgi:type I restriction enzyme, R subunit
LVPQPEQQARSNIDALLVAAGWHVCDAAAANIHAARGVAIREFPLPGFGFADYLLYVDGKAAGVIEAKKEGVTLTGVETQSDKYTKGLPARLPCWHNPLPFAYQSTGIETRFTNGLDPSPRSRPVFAFHQPKLLAEWLAYLTPSPRLRGEGGGEGHATHAAQPPATFLARLQSMPPLKEEGLWPAQITAIKNLEHSLKENRPRALIQMATGSGKTFTSISFIYRLIKFAGARRVLFLVDRGNLADLTLKEFQQYVSPYNNFKFSEEYIVQRLQGNQIDTTARVCICTIQRLYSILKGRDLPADLEEESVGNLLLPSPSGRGAGDEGALFASPEPIEYNPAIPIETFDLIVTDEAHRSIYNLWAQVLEYFDAYLVGLTATPGKQTFGFFHQNLVMEYNHEMAVADGVNVNYDVYRIKTAITEAGSKVEAGYYVEKQERDTRKTRWEELDDDFAYDPNQFDRDVVTPDQIRTIVRAFRDKLFSEIFPGRTEVPKTLIFAKDDNLGLMVEGIEIYCPLTPNLALGMWCPSHREKLVEDIQRLDHLSNRNPTAAERFVGAWSSALDIVEAIQTGKPLRSLPENVEHFNSLQVVSAERFLFSSNGDFALVEDMIRTSPELRYGRRLQEASGKF